MTELAFYVGDWLSGYNRGETPNLKKDPQFSYACETFLHYNPYKFLAPLILKVSLKINLDEDCSLHLIKIFYPETQTGHILNGL